MDYRWNKPQRKVRTPNGSTGANSPRDDESHRRNSGTERMSQVATILWPGTGGCKGAKRVKTAKLCAEQDQIGKRS
jgi:hypothetical protein